MPKFLSLLPFVGKVCSTLHWCSPTLSTLCSFKYLCVWTSNFWRWPRWTALSGRLRRSALVCSAGRRQGWGVTLSQSTTSSRASAEEEVLISLLLNYRTQGSRMKLSGEDQIRKRFFFERVVRPWNRVFSVKSWWRLLSNCCSGWGSPGQ